jgi:hypothetical protein
MTQQVSPAVIVIVAILLLAVIVALYYLVNTEKQESPWLAAPVPKRLRASERPGSAVNALEGETGAAAGNALAVGTGK